MIIKKELKEIMRFLDSLNVLYYFHAGFAMHLYGLESELDDCDIRIYHDDITRVYKMLKNASLHEVRLRGSAPYSKGIYDNLCIEIINGTNFDICSRMVALCDIGRFEFPYEKNVFKDISLLSFEDLSIPVASLENLFLYYLVLRRNDLDGKDDKQRVRELLGSKFLDKNKLKHIFNNVPFSDKITALYFDALRKYDMS